ncbi:MAG: 2-amino-4-hydroxy-6-hydroxymethyldihydropteridine diphosphokinase [Epsilonproteobacteria bacterium]|nr:MAG: 2-amino-4-hydroxy-6-hydroxymethyldihydropteridine diphosphokinase [Campylobacterota bacterium]RLA67552.1 MAG: 2-amino-4-hydroxy-6-hydroxymethyldihydropteridine diphosphokinase [Campylobacterota bacterium]
MSLFIGLGTNLGDKKQNLAQAEIHLQAHFKLISKSQTYSSPAIDYLDQPDFHNQVIEFELPDLSPNEVMKILLKVENDMGRQRHIPKGPRIIDLDLLFFGAQTFKSSLVEIPHPRSFERSFVILPLMELPGFTLIKNRFSFPQNFSNFSRPL